MRRLGVLMMFLVVLSSCMKEDDAITLPAPGPVKQGTANMGLNYENQVYFDLETGIQLCVLIKTMI